jgi:phage tail-like protein
MPAATRTDPYAVFNFVVEIDGIPAAMFSEASGLASETELIEYRTGADKTNTVRKLPGLTKYPNIVLKRGITRDLSLWTWRKAIVDGNPDRRNGTITLLDETRQPVLRWRFVRGLPVKWEGPTLNAQANEVAIETLEIAHEGLELEAA